MTSPRARAPHRAWYTCPSSRGALRAPRGVGLAPSRTRSWWRSSMPPSTRVTSSSGATRRCRTFVALTHTRARTHTRAMKQRNRAIFLWVTRRRRHSFRARARTVHVRAAAHNHAAASPQQPCPWRHNRGSPLAAHVFLLIGCSWPCRAVPFMIGAVHDRRSQVVANYVFPKPKIPGADLAGVVVEVVLSQ